MRQRVVGQGAGERGVHHSLVLLQRLERRDGAALRPGQRLVGADVVPLWQRALAHRHGGVVLPAVACQGVQVLQEGRQGGRQREQQLRQERGRT